METIKDNKRILEIKKDIEIIKPYLESIGYDFSEKNSKDQMAFKISRKDNLRYLAFRIFRGVEVKSFYEINEEVDDKEYFGQVVYNTDGKVLLDCIKDIPVDLWYEKKQKETYFEEDPSYVFVGDKLVISAAEDEWIDLDERYSIYKLKDGKYELKRKGKFCIARLVKTSFDELFIKENEKLYSVKKMKPINNPEIHDINGVETNYNKKDNNLHYGSREIREKLQSTIENNNVLLGHELISGYHNYKSNRGDLYAILDTNGNVVGKYYFKTYCRIYTIEPVNKTYDEVKKKCIEYLINELIIVEREEKRRKDKQQRMWDISESILIDELDNAVSKGQSRKLKPLDK